MHYILKGEPLLYFNVSMFCLKLNKYYILLCICIYVFPHHVIVYMYCVIVFCKRLTLTMRIHLSWVRFSYKLYRAASDV